MEMDMENFDPENSRELDELLNIIQAPLGHVDIQSEVERMGTYACMNKWMENRNPYFKGTILQNKFRKSWCEVTSTVEERDQFDAHEVWSRAWKDRYSDQQIEICADKKLRWK
jgi:hypothetical protein